MQQNSYSRLSTLHKVLALQCGVDMEIIYLQNDI